MKELYFFIKIFIKHLIFSFKPNSFKKSLSTEQIKILKSIEKNGCYIQPNFLNKNDTEMYRAEIERIFASASTKLWRDKVDSDKRIYGANQISEMIENYFKGQHINQIIDAHEKTDNKSGFVMAAKMDYKDNNSGSGDGWHRDRADKWQTKSILYLCEVKATSGPFQYILYSHRPLYILRDWLRYGIEPSQARVSNEKLDRLIQKEPSRLVECTASAGSLLFANTLGLHRGKPIEEGQRMAMTTYFWANMDIPEHIQKVLQN